MTQPEKEKDIRVSAFLSPELNDKLLEKTKGLSPDAKISLANFIEAAIAIDDKYFSAQIKIIGSRKKEDRRRKSELNKKIDKLSPEAIAKIQAIVDAEG